MASMITFGVTIGLIQTVLRKYEVVGTLHAELEQFCAVLGGVQKVLQNVMEEQNQGKLGPPLKKDGSFLALKQIHAAVQEGNNVIDDIIHTRKCVVNFFSDEYLSKIKRATAKIQLALTSATFANVAGLSQVTATITNFHATVDTHHSEIVETLQKHENRLEQMNLLMQAHLVENKEEFAQMLTEAADKAEIFYRDNKPLIDKNMYEWVLQMSREEKASRDYDSMDSPLLCPISKDIMEDPVLLVQSGNSYDRKHLCQSLLSYPTLDPQSGMEYAKPLEYVDNVVVRSMLIDKGRYVKHNDTEFLAQYPVVWKKKMTELGFLGDDTLHSTHRLESERSGGHYVVGAEPDDQSKNACSGAFFKQKKGLIVVVATIAALVAIFVSIVVATRRKNSDDTESFLIPPTEMPQTSTNTNSQDGSQTDEGNQSQDGSQTDDGNRFPDIVSLVNSLTLSGQVLEYPSPGIPTPEEQALAWLVEEDPLSLDTAMDATRIQQRYALLSLWFHTAPTLGANSSSWLDVPDECAWEGVVRCNDAMPVRQVTELDMSVKNLAGEIPHDLGLLTQLTSVRLSSNALRGSIPSSLSNLSSLEELNLNFNGLDGRLPSSLSELSQLTVLDVAFNHLTGSIPLWLSQLPDLTLLDFSANKFEGAIPSTSLPELTSLTYLGMHTNLLTGTIPPTLSRLSRLDWVAFAANPGLTGTIPAELVSWSNIFEVFFFDTNINGTMPLCSLDKEHVHLVVDCLEVECPCCTHCCPSAVNGIPEYEYC